MQLLEKYFMVKLDNLEDEGFNYKTLEIMLELGLEAYGRKDLSSSIMSEKMRKIRVNKLSQDEALKILEDKLNKRGKCDKCNGWLTSQFFEKRLSRRQKQTEKARIALKESGYNGVAGGLSKSEKKIKACKANAARLNASLTPEQRAEIQKKRIATMTRKREERERLKKELNK